MLVQAVVFAGAAGWAASRSTPMLVAAVLAVLGQIGVVAGVVRGRTDWVRWGGGASLLGAVGVAAPFVQVAFHLIFVLGHDHKDLGLAILSGVVVGAPWFGAVPAWQVGTPGRFLGLLALVGLAPGVLDLARVRDHAGADAVAVGTWLRDRAGPPPPITGPWAVVTVRDARGVATTAGVGAEALRGLAPVRGPVVVEVAQRTRPATAWGVLGGLTVVAGEAVEGPDGAWRSWLSLRHEARFDGLSLGLVVVPTGAVVHDVDAAIVDEGGVRRLSAGWSPAPPLAADALRAAAFDGARMLAAYQKPDGSFAYTVQGWTGAPGKGYQWTRHAGATWFLADVARRTGDPALTAAARRAIGRMAREVKWTKDGRAWLDDPLRKDGNGWIGNTALAFLALRALDEAPELQRGMARFLADAVAADGQIRGVMQDADESFFAQPDSAYAVGQGWLALLEADAAGLLPAGTLDRAQGWVDRGYWPAPTVVVEDEHWACLARAVARRRGARAGARMCEAYLDQMDHAAALGDGATHGPSAGGIAAHLEALVAAWEVDRADGRSSRWEAPARRLGQWMLANTFRPADGALLADRRLVGGLRDGPWRVEVRIDAVQHAGFAMLTLADQLEGG